ncbi:MAG: hypothetical protein R6W92_09930 [Desulfocurvibacter africanus]
MTLFRTAALTIGATLLISATTASAGDIPKYDVDAYCRSVAQAGDNSNTLYNSCIDMEQMAYDGLKASKDQVPDKTASQCDSVARSIGGSYMILMGCIDQEMQATINKKVFQY